MISRNRNQELSAAIRSHQWHSPAGVRILERELQWHSGSSVALGFVSGTRIRQWHSPAGVRILEREMQPPPQKDLGELELSLGQEL